MADDDAMTRRYAETMPIRDAADGLPMSERSLRRLVDERKWRKWQPSPRKIRLYRDDVKRLERELLNEHTSRKRTA